MSGGHFGSGSAGSKRLREGAEQDDGRQAAEDQQGASQGPRAAKPMALRARKLLIKLKNEDLPFEVHEQSREAKESPLSTVSTALDKDTDEVRTELAAQHVRDLDTAFETFSDEDSDTRKVIMQSLADAFNVSASVYFLAIGKRDDEPFTVENYRPREVRDTEVGESLSFASFKGKLYRLVAADSSGAQWNDDGYASGSDVEEEQHEDVKLQTYKDIGDQEREPYSWVLCTSCKNWRMVTRTCCKKNRYEFEGQEFICCNTDGMFEAKCADVGIWSLVYSFLAGSEVKDRKELNVLKGGGKNSSELQVKRDIAAYKRMLKSRKVYPDYHEEPSPDDPFIDISYLFIAVRSFGSLELTPHGYLKKIAQDQLGMQGRGCVKALKRFYTELFGHVVGHDTLEVHLIKNLQVRHMITQRQLEIFDDLGLTEQDHKHDRKVLRLEWTSKATGKDREWENQAQRWRDGKALESFVEESRQVYRSEDVEQMLNFFIERAEKLIQALKLSNETFFIEVADLFGDIISEATSLAQQHQEERRKLVMVGRPRAGKSFTIDCCLRLSERDKHTYRSRNRPPAGQEGDPKDLYTTAYVDAITLVEKHNKLIEVQDEAADAMQTDDDGRKLLRLERHVARQLDLDMFGSDSSPIFEREKKSVEAFRKYHKVVDSDVGISKLKKTIQPFLLPTAQDAASTTSISISVRRSDRYQVVLKYKTLDGLVSDWLKKQRLEVSKQELTETSKKKDRTWVTDVLKKEEKIRDFLKSEDASHLTGEQGVLSRVLVFSGAGEDALQDRLFIRRIMHHAQGVHDDTTSGDLIPPTNGEAALHPLVSEDSVEAMKWGKLTRIALEQIILYSPSQMAPGRHGEWIDTPGVGDADPIKRHVFERDLARADAAICLVKETNISADLPLCESLRKSKLMLNIVEKAASAGAPSVSSGRVAILHVIEEKKPRDLPATSCTGACDVSDESVRCNSCLLKLLSLQKFTDIAEKLAEVKEIDWEGDDEEHTNCMKSSVKLLVPFVMRFTSIMLDPRSSTKDLARTEVYEVLGSVEQFLRSSVSRQAGRVLKKQKALVADLDNLALTLADGLSGMDSNSHKEQRCWMRLHDVFLMGEEGLAKSLESCFKVGEGLAELGGGEVEACREKLVNMFEHYSNECKAPEERYVSGLLLNDLLESFASAVCGALTETVIAFTVQLNDGFCKEMLGIIAPVQLDKTRMEEKLSSLAAFINNSNGGLRQSLLDMIKKVDEHARSSEVQDKVREHVMRRVAKYTGASLERRVLDNIEAAQKEGLLNLALILKRFLCANYADPFAAAQGAVPLSSVLIMIKTKWLRQAVRHARRGFKDSATTQSEIAGRKDLIDNIKMNLKVFAETLHVACENLETPKGLDVIGKLCSDDFRLQRQREYFAQETQTKLQMLDNAVPLPPPGQCAHLGIDGHIERKENFVETGFERIKPKPLLDKLEDLKCDKYQDGSRALWSAKRWSQGISWTRDELAGRFQSLNADPRLKLATLRTDILTMCAKMIAPEGADLMPVKAQVRLAVTSHAMEWHDEVQGKSLDEYQLWDRTKTDEISRFCDQLSDLNSDPPDLDLRFVLVLASYLKLPLHVYSYNCTFPWRIEPWTKDKEPSSPAEEGPKNDPKALAVAFLGYKVTGSGRNQKKEGVWQACVVDRKAEKKRLETVAKGKVEMERLDERQREQERLQNQAKRTKNDSGRVGASASGVALERVVAESIESRAQHDLERAGERFALQLLGEDSRSGSSHFERDDCEAQMDAQIEQNVAQIEEEASNEAVRQINAGAPPKAVAPAGPQYQNKMLQMSRWTYRQCSDGKTRYMGPGVVTNEQCGAYEEDGFNKLVNDYPQFGKRFGIKDGQKTYKIDARTKKRAGADTYKKKDIFYILKHKGQRMQIPAPACDDDFGMEDNMLSVFHGYYTGSWVSGHLARKLAEVCRQESAVVLKHDPPQNMSLMIVDRALHKVKDSMRSDFDPGPTQTMWRTKDGRIESAETYSSWRIASCSGAVVTLVQSTMHTWQMGDTLWMLLRMRGNAWKVEELSAPEYHRSEPLCKSLVYQKHMQACRDGKKGPDGKRIPVPPPHPFCACIEGKECNPVPLRLVLGNLKESLRKGVVKKVQVQEGDIVILGSNGIFDNLRGGKPHKNFALKETIEGIVEEAKQSWCEDSMTPFEEHLGQILNQEAQDSMYKEKFKNYGVAPRSSDCAVVVASITLKNQSGERFKDSTEPSLPVMPPRTHLRKFRKSEPKLPKEKPSSSRG